MDYQFTFNLSKVEEKHLTAINFQSQPTKSDVDVDFAIKCINKGGQSQNAMVITSTYLKDIYLIQIKTPDYNS